MDDNIKNAKEEARLEDAPMETKLKPTTKNRKPASPPTKGKAELEAAKEKDLISKAYVLVVGVLVAVVLVYVFDAFVQTPRTSDIITLLSTALMFILGFLFGSSKK